MTSVEQIRRGATDPLATVAAPSDSSSIFLNVPHTSPEAFLSAVPEVVRCLLRRDSILFDNVDTLVRLGVGKRHESVLVFETVDRENYRGGK